ncbi:hypothetical protein [Egicoccus sp. AB-alg6-2]|uniref:hypothetical protein n=1 Tax=Egicoccus sp. AB-alg6-2 TaxID=3242692 RepID=UPI00359D7F3D
MTDLSVPDRLPVLSRGRHRNPRKGACFMELASYLAGERWSDHPACTHPLLAAVARAVNDCTSDEARPQLAPLIPSVIGLTSDDPRVTVRIARRCAVAALPVVAFERQRMLAVALLTCERLLDDLDGRQPGSMDATTREALAQVPDAAAWARRFTNGIRSSPKDFPRYTAPRIVGVAVKGIAEACVPDPAVRLRDLLVEVIDECRSDVDREASPAADPGPAMWHEVCSLTGAVPVR